MKKKIGWFRRLFLTWDMLVKYIDDNQNNNIDNEELIKLRERTNSLNDLLEKEKELTGEFRKQLDNKDRDFAKAKEEAKESDMLARNASASEVELKHQIDRLKSTLEAEKDNRKLLNEDVLKKLQPLSKIDKTFFGKAGSKGKGMLGEMQLDTMLSKVDISNDLWTKNLQVGKNIVEFAIKSGEDDNKWIPIDSKVLESEYTEDNKIIIDDAYTKRVRTQAKEISKYLSRSNTTSYGLLVLQSNEIFTKLFNDFPGLFKESISEFKVFITSPASFIQMAHSISNIIKIQEKINKDEKIYDEMVSIITTVDKFAKSLNKVNKDFNVAMNTHYPAFQNKQNKLVKKLEHEGKVKALPNLNDKDSPDE